MRPSTRIMIRALEGSQPRDGNSLGQSSCPGRPPCALPRLTPEVTEPALCHLSLKGSDQHCHCRSHWTPLAGNVLSPAFRCSVLRSEHCREEGKSLSSERSGYVWRGCCHPSLFFRLKGENVLPVFSCYELSLRGGAALSATFLLFLTLLALQDKRRGFALYLAQHAWDPGP